MAVVVGIVVVGIEDGLFCVGNVWGWGWGLCCGFGGGAGWGCFVWIVIEYVGV